MNIDESNIISYRLLLESAVDWKKKIFHEKEFFDFIFKKSRTKTLLDLRSGSGQYIFSLYGIYSTAIGVDSDSFLIENALRKSEDFPGTTFINSSFNKLLDELNSKKLPKLFDTILLLNNSLSSIINQDNIIDYLRQIHDLISSNGVLIISTFNYNKLMKYQDYEFTSQKFYHLENLYMLTRNMKILDEDLISYSANIYDSAGHIVHEHKELQFPLTKKRIIDFLEKAGFSDIEFYGDFSFSDFNVDDSKKIILVAHKKS